MEVKGCEECTVHMSEWCQRGYKKASKKTDRRLREIVESELDLLRHDARRGSKLERDLKGMYSIHIDQFSYRIVYEVDHSACNITVHKIGRRKSAYDSGRSWRTHGRDAGRARS